MREGRLARAATDPLFRHNAGDESWPMNRVLATHLVDRGLSG